MLGRTLPTNLLLAAILLLGPMPARAQDAGERDRHHGTTGETERDDDDEVHAIARRVGKLERKLDKLDRKLDRLMALLEGHGKNEPEEVAVKEADVPNAVFGAFRKAYPAGKTLGWVHEGDEYEVKFEDSGRKFEVAFAEEGSIKEVEQEIELAYAPAPVKAAFAASKYGKLPIARMTKETKAAKPDAPVFELVLKDGDKGAVVVFEKDGKLAKEREVPAEKFAKWLKSIAPAPDLHARLFVKAAEVPLEGEGSWDYVTVDPAAKRAYVAHLTKVDVVDLVRNETVGEVQGLEGAHGTALVPELKRGYSTSGRNNKLVVFDLDTLKVTNEVACGEGPDCVIPVASVGEVWTMNHKGGTITCVDAKTLEVKKTIEVGGALEFAREDAAKGVVYLNVEDKDLVVAVDTRKHEVTARYPVAPGKAPAGLAYDPKNGLLFVGCDNKQLVVLDAATGKVVTSLESGEHCDGCAFDLETGNVFASCRGASWAFHVKDARTVEVLGALDSGKTCSLDPTTHRVYITAGTRGEKNSVRLMVFAMRSVRAPVGDPPSSRPDSARPESGTRRASGPSRVDRLKEAVGLTDEQVQKATAIEQQMYADMDKARAESGDDRAARAQKMSALIEKMRSDIRAFMQSDQLAKFDAWVAKEEEQFRSRGQQQARGGRGGQGGGGDSAPENQRPVNGHPDKTIALGSGGFDYLTASAASRRLYVAHSTKVDVIDMEKDEKIGEIEGVEGAHGTAIALAAKHGFATAGRKQKLIAFDLDTNKVLKEIDTGTGPDAVLYASSVDEAWSINHRGGNVTCVDAKTLEVKATIDIGGTLEFAAEVGDRVFVNVEDRNLVAAIDARKHEVVARYETAPGEGPAGLASDPKNGLIFAGCHNRKMVALDAATGKVVATFDIGQGCDAVAFDPETGKVYASCGDGTTTVVRVKDARTFGPPHTIETVRGGKCCAVDSKTHKLYVASAPRRNEAGESKVLVFLPEAKSPD